MALAALPFHGAGSARPALQALAALAVVLVVAALVVGEWAAGVALLALVAELGVRTVAQRVSPWLTVLEAAALLALAELVFWTRALARDALVDPAVVSHRLAGLALAAALAAGAALLTLLGASL